ncbi:MAG TPA: hypothetical protein VMG32_02145 [Anaeromyxobacteraceae bacterium]|nr:hypothetical protein [Anaeromyxobacteraceae bacterium]
MKRPGSPNSLDDVLRRAVDPVLRRASAEIARALGALARAELDQEVAGGRRKPPPARVRRRAELSRWVADRGARRVPLFVIEMTNGLDTKEKIVAKFGPGATFEKGKALPAAK